MEGTHGARFIASPQARKLALYLQAGGVMSHGPFSLPPGGADLRPVLQSFDLAPWLAAADGSKEPDHCPRPDLQGESTALPWLQLLTISGLQQPATSIKTGLGHRPVSIKAWHTVGLTKYLLCAPL